MKRKLYIDTEATSLTDPRLVQLGAMLSVDGENPVGDGATLDLLIKPNRWAIEPGASAVNGLTTEMCQERGVPITEALAALARLWKETDIVVAYGVEFDIHRVLVGELSRAGFRLDQRPTFCARDAAAKYCRMPPTEKMIAAGRASQFKTPKLAEALLILCDQRIEDLGRAHDALTDVKALMAVHRALVRVAAERKAREAAAGPEPAPPVPVGAPGGYGAAPAAQAPQAAATPTPAPAPASGYGAAPPAPASPSPGPPPGPAVEPPRIFLPPPPAPIETLNKAAIGSKSPIHYPAYVEWHTVIENVPELVVIDIHPTGRAPLPPGVHRGRTFHVGGAAFLLMAEAVEAINRLRAAEREAINNPSPGDQQSGDVQRTIGAELRAGEPAAAASLGGGA